jgi:hypothetical protein
VIGQVVRTLLFLGFVVLGSRIPRLPPGSPGRGRAINLLLAYVLLVHLSVVATQVDGWPFSSFPMMANDTTRQPVTQRMIQVQGVDRADREWDVDPLAWSPLFPQSIRGWFEIVYPRASPAELRTVAAFLFRRAEEARRARADHRAFGNERWLGSLAAPDTYWYPPVAAAPEAFSGLRVYRVLWDRGDPLAGPHRVRRELLVEYREP